MKILNKYYENKSISVFPKPPINPENPDSAISIIWDLLQPDPDNRISLEDAYQRFLQNQGVMQHPRDSSIVL